MTPIIKTFILINNYAILILRFLFFYVIIYLDKKKGCKRMEIYNCKMFEQIKKELFKENYDKERNYTDKEIEQAVLEGNFKFLGSGCSRTVLKINNDIIVKITNSTFNHKDFENFDYQGDNSMEIETYKELNGSDKILELYAWTDEHSLIFAERLDTNFTLSQLALALKIDEENLLIEIPDREKPLINTDNSGAKYGDNLMDYLEDFFDNLADVHSRNIGFDKKGLLKMLDLGYGLIY